ncbi:YihY/virulence factor BrkB family protein [Patulibacter sp. SYSU D01012]|uniref:YihY/virulence factor BrkB family protein n=1 Tax=Patulibacter sp. SYSU D01012 TaxID=2817381 RepID=UPI001B3088BD|nr:YihY/virulence factor BrkB family protein [Patulibacter sp. SYSU D01012]
MTQIERTGHTRETGLLPTLRRTWSEFQEDRLTDQAAALTYYGVLSLFPALIALVSLVGLFADPAKTTQAIQDVVAQLGPSSAADTFAEPIRSITSQRGTSGVMLVVGIVSALWSASGYIGAFMRVSNVIYEVDEGRPIWKLRPLQMLVTLVMLLLVVVGALAVVVSGPLADAVGSALGLSDTFVSVFKIAKWPILLVIVMLIVSVLYWASPNAKLPGFRFVTPGSALAVVVWVVGSLIFAFYVANFGSYDKTYGTLGGVVVFLVWLWLTNVAILLGHQLNAERERTTQIEEGVPGAERELQIPERDAPDRDKRPKSA